MQKFRFYPVVTWFVLSVVSLGYAQEEVLILRRVAREFRPKGEERKQEAVQTLYLRGRVVDEKSGEPLVGAYVRVLGSVLGAVTDDKGEFRIATTIADPVLVEVSYVGYQSQRVSLLPGPSQKAPEEIRLREQEIVGEEVVISASRIEEAFMRSPVQVAQLSGRLVADSPTPLFSQTLSFLPGVQVMHTSFTFPVINTRGFGNTQNPRFINRVDGIEMQSTALNIPVITFTSPAEIDIAKAEVVAGPASALYGPNAFNGALSITLKDPFQYPGLSVWLQTGVNHIASPDRRPAPYYNAQLRFAKSWKNRFGIKATFQWLSGVDWYANSTRDIGSYAGATGIYALPGPENPGYKPENGYGYDARIFISPGRLPFANGTPMPGLYIARTGYLEPELLTPEARILKGSAGFTYRLSDQIEVSLFSHLATGSTIYQANTRYALYDFIYHAHKLELKHSRGFVRLYGMKEDGGRSTPLGVLGANLLDAVKPHTVWFPQFLLAYGGYLEASMSAADKEAFERHYRFPVPAMGDAAAARRLADADTRYLMQLPTAAPVAGFLGTRWDVGEARPLPGSPRLRALIDSLLNIPVNQGGGQLIDRCGLYHLETQYELPRIGGIQTLIGGNFRLFEINSAGTIFIDTTGKPFWNYEYGAFVQVRRGFWEERLQLTAAVRFDQRQYVLRGRLTPRLMATYALDKKGHHVIRGGYQMGFRNPISEALFIRLQTEALLIGALPQTDRELGIAGTNNYTLASVRAYREAISRGVPPEEAAQLLRSVPINGLRPEIVHAFEVGTRHQLLNQRLLIDLSYAYNRYKDMHGNIRIYGPADPTQQLSPADVNSNRLSPLYGRYYNIPGTPQAQFFTMGLQYQLMRHLRLAGGYTYAQAWGLEEGKSLDPGLIVSFNTPPHQTSLGLIGEEIGGRWGFQVWHQWVHAYYFEITTFQGIVPTYNLFHAQVSYRLTRWPMQFRIGAQNLLNFYHIEARGGPSIGGLYYFQVMYDRLGW
jgi:iron complex outermembrane recepter protein